MNPLVSLFGMLLVVAGLVGLVLPALPGMPFIAAGIALVAWGDGFARIGPATLFVVALIGLVGWALDYVAGVLGARKAGASRWGVAGAVAGLAAGLPFGLPGLILGPGLGATLFEYLKDPDFRRAARAGTGVFLGFVVGTILKYACAFTMIGLAVFAYFF